MFVSTTFLLVMVDSSYCVFVQALLKEKVQSLPKLEEYPFFESLYVPPSGPTIVENPDDAQERELVLFVYTFSVIPVPLFLFDVVVCCTV